MSNREILTEISNMCMITDSAGRVLVQHHVRKSPDSWSGLTFPGGHVEAGESVVASVIREVREETGLEVSGLEPCGYVDWYNPEKHSRYFVFLFRTDEYSGNLVSSREGKMEWMTLPELFSGHLAPNMESYLRVFLEKESLEFFGWNGTPGKVIDGSA